MKNFANNRAVLAAFAVLMAIGLIAAYVPMLFPQSQDAPTDDVNAPADQSDYAAQLPKNANSIATTTTSTIPAKASLPDAFSGLDKEQNSLNELNNLLDK